MKEAIESVCNSLVESHLREIREEHTPYVEEIMEERKSDLYKPYDFYIMHTGKRTEHISVLVEKMYPGTTRMQQFMIENIYVNCLLIKQHIENLLDCHTGGLTDKSTYLMEKFIRFVAFKEEVHFSREREWSQPDFGNFLQWMKFIEQTIQFINGRLFIEQYYETVKELKDLKAEYLAEEERIRKELTDYFPEYLEHLKMMESEYKISDEQFAFLTGIRKGSALYYCKNEILERKCMTGEEFYNVLYGKIVEYLKEYMS